jgi:predicted nucleic-acid-binding protein
MARNNSGSVDTNILLRLLLNDVPAQTDTVKRMLDGRSRYDVADSAIIEMVFVLEKQYKIEREVIVQYIQYVVKNSQFSCNTNLFLAILPLYLSEKSLSINDCALLGYARLNKATPLHTFDKKLVSKSEGDASHP